MKKHAIPDPEAPIVVSYTAGARGQSQVLTATFRLHLMDQPPPFLSAGLCVNPGIARTATGLTVRFTAGTAVRLYKSPGRKTGNVCLAQFAVPHGSLTVGVTRTPVDHDYTDAWLEITVPDGTHQAAGQDMSKRRTSYLRRMRVSKDRAFGETIPVCSRPPSGLEEQAFPHRVPPLSRTPSASIYRTAATIGRGPQPKAGGR